MTMTTDALTAAATVPETPPAGGKRGAAPLGCLTVDFPDVEWPQCPDAAWDDTGATQKEWIAYLADSVAQLRSLAHAHRREHAHGHA